jgi:hypothetical protein
MLRSICLYSVTDVSVHLLVPIFKRQRVIVLCLFSEMSRGVDWKYITDVSGKPVGSHFQEASIPSTWTLEILWNITRCIYIQGDQNVSLHLMITIHKATSNVQNVPRQSPDIYEGVSNIFRTGAAIYTAVMVARSTGRW